ncbi:MAG: asparagine synthase (glutamine-hydrolyzing) [Terriglobales bacterium]|jgi:asparagine synthase (glutamine-hydrolysing)
MCGIVGFLSDGRPEETRAAVRNMMAASQHRGPDASGSVEIPRAAGSANYSLVLGHTRLSIIDLSDGSRQPMQDAESGSWLAFNGEIYNFRQLRAELETLGMKFATSGDSEVLLKALVQWGERALEKLEGMFAFAFWDDRNRNLLVARDRVGMKPLYYYAGPRGFAFASEVKVLERAQICSLTVDHDSVASFLAYGAVIGPKTIFKEIRELEPGHLLRVSARGEIADSEYWSLRRSLAESAPADCQDFDHAVAQVRERLEYAVSSHLVSDVPVGVFLSGGVDSSLLALVASRYAKPPITLLTVAFPEQEFSELPYAREIARGLPHHHEVVTLTPEQLRELLPFALGAMDQPTVDGINTYVISRVGAALGLKVLLTGIGGDELFGGYTTFTKVPKLLRYGAGLRPAARVLAKLRTKNPIQWQKVADAGPPRNLAEAYMLQRSIRWRQQNSGAGSRPAQQSLQESIEFLANDFQKLAALELQFYARNQLLRDADVFSMANSVELRVPFLDTRLIAVALGISPGYHFEGGRGKRITRRILSELAGEQILQRRKMGFTFPWQQWLSRELKETIACTLRDKQLYEPLCLDAAYGGRLLDGLERGDRLQSWSEVWSLFVLLNWQCRTGVEYAVS